MIRRCAALVLLLAVLPLAGCSRRGEADNASPADAGLVAVAVEVLQAGEARALVRVWGTVRPAREAAIHVEIPGTVTATRVSLGDRVEKGQVLIEIDPALHRARVREAEVSLESARASAGKLRRDLERAEALYREKNISDSEVEAARNRALEADALHAAADAALQQARKNLAAAEVRAPFDGRVAARPPDVGTTVTLGAPLVTIVDVETVRVDAFLSEQDLRHVTAGTEVSLAVDGLPGKTFTGTVSAVGPQAEAGSLQFPVEIAVDNRPERLLRGGMVARVEIVHATYAGVPLLPVDALVETPDGDGFFAVRDGKAELRGVELGPREGERVAVLSGASPGDTVVVVGQNRLAEGTRVRVDEVR
jgi:membrane fusion protein (multidrug efflux system)